MARKHDTTTPEQGLQEPDLATALAELDAAADSARAAGRPLTPHTLGGEQREMRAQRRRLSYTVRVTRDRVACQFDDPGIGPDEA